ncbi:MAG: hypothetical protein GC202_13385 [Alphaproteobacteria bacterium]|nr:hypothetical protein [Alphaproteobacteria bacterium]
MSLCGMSACASIVSGTESTTYLETKPVDARCRLHGQDFTREVNTPASVPLPAKSSPVTVECNADGYQRATQELEASMDGWVFGNLIFGGIVGGVIDIARGAGKKFPPQIQVVMDPATFKTEAERDRHYDERVRVENEQWDRAIATVRGQCDSAGSTECQRRVTEAEDRRKAEVDKIEANRRSSRIAG